MSTKKVRIETRRGPCKCGCKGSDPWHRKTYHRAIENARAVENGPSVDGMPGLAFVVSDEGEAIFPWGRERVVFVSPRGPDGRILRRLGTWYTARQAERDGFALGGVA